jgi:hypothetical protein
MTETKQEGENTLNGKQIIPEHWVEKSAASFSGNRGIDLPGTDQRNTGYSYTWWTKSFFDSGKTIDMFYDGG